MATGVGGDGSEGVEGQAEEEECGDKAGVWHSSDAMNTAFRTECAITVPIQSCNAISKRPNWERFEYQARFAWVRTSLRPKNILSLHFSEARSRCPSLSCAARSGRKTEQRWKGLVGDGGGRKLKVTFPCDCMMLSPCYVVSVGD